MRSHEWWRSPPGELTRRDVAAQVPVRSINTIKAWEKRGWIDRPRVVWRGSSQIAVFDSQQVARALLHAAGRRAAPRSGRQLEVARETHRPLRDIGRFARVILQEQGVAALLQVLDRLGHAFTPLGRIPRAERGRVREALRNAMSSTHASGGISRR